MSTPSEPWKNFCLVFCHIGLDLFRRTGSEFQLLEFMFRSIFRARRSSTCCCN